MVGPSRHSYDPRRVCLVQLPKLHLGPRKREAGVYIAGVLFAAGWWLFADACLLSSRATPPPDAPYDIVPVRVRFPDWIPGLCSTFGMIIVNLIDKQRLLSDYDDSPSSFGGSVAWKARLFLFLGFALMAGGLAGSVTVLVLKYVVPDWKFDGVIYWGVANVLQSILIMMSACVLWIAQNSDQDYEYNLSL